MSDRRHFREVNFPGDDDGAVQVYSDRFVVKFRTGWKDQTDRYLHIEWRQLPWLARQLWSAWRRHRADAERNINWTESELHGGGVK